MTPFAGADGDAVAQGRLLVGGWGLPATMARR